jgi:polar amino acid transport system substrate-binding protein
MHFSLPNRGIGILKWLISAFCVLALPYSQASLAETQTLVLNDTNAAPFTTETGDGFLDIIAREAFRRADFGLKLERLPAERGLLNANTGLDDGDLSRIAGLEKIYPNLVRVPEKLVDWHFVAFTRKPDLRHITWSMLQPLAVGHIKGWKIYEQNLLQHQHVTTAGSAEQLFTMLDKNRIEVALYERSMGLALVQKMGIQNIRIIEPSLAEREMFIYLHRKHADKAPAIAAALRDIKREGLYVRVCQAKLAPFKAETTQCQVR